MQSSRPQCDKTNTEMEQDPIISSSPAIKRTAPEIGSSLAETSDTETTNLTVTNNKIQDDRQNMEQQTTQKTPPKKQKPESLGEKTASEIKIDSIKK